MNNNNVTGKVTENPDVWRYARVLRPILAFAIGAHGLFLVLFVALQVPVMTAFNIASVALYGGLILLVRRVDSRWIVLTASIEVLAHAWLATHYVGWSSGFHIYPLILIPVLAFLTTSSFGQRCVCILAVAALHGVMALAYTGSAPAAPLPVELLPWLNAANVIFASIGMSIFILFYALAIHNADTLARKAQQRLQVLAATDPLTGLLNRRSMDGLLRQSVAARRPATLLLADIDKFKRINDELGHDAGDQVLAAVGRMLQASVREEDHVARWGGEEFLVLLPGSDTADATRVAERIRRQIPGCWHGREGRGLTISIGIATLQSRDTPHSLIRRADRALLLAKRGGRDRIIDEDTVTRT